MAGLFLFFVIAMVLFNMMGAYVENMCNNNHLENN